MGLLTEMKAVTGKTRVESYTHMLPDYSDCSFNCPKQTECVLQRCSFTYDGVIPRLMKITQLTELTQLTASDVPRALKLADNWRNSWKQSLPCGSTNSS